MQIGKQYIEDKAKVMPDRFNKDALYAYQELYLAAKQENIDLIIFSAYRSYEKQTTLWKKTTNPRNL